MIHSSWCTRLHWDELWKKNQRQQGSVLYAITSAGQLSKYGLKFLKKIFLCQMDFIRIIEPLTSRCSKFRFKPLSDDILKKRLKFIASEENVAYDEQVGY